jgi:hypothetical protein
VTVENALVAVILAAAAAVTVHFLRRSLRAREKPLRHLRGVPHTAAGACPVPPGRAACPGPARRAAPMSDKATNPWRRR